MRLLLLISLFLFSIGVARSQAPGRIAIRGTIVDTANAVMPGATIMLLTPKDSALVSYGRSGDKGTFEIKNAKRGPYLLKIIYVGYFPVQQLIEPGEGAILDAGTIKLKPITKELFEVVVRTAKAPMMIKGDTIEYNTSSFKVPPGSTVEDLLRKLPGVLVDPDGNIKAQGQDVKRVTVDGKSFFGADPKLATKNLSAEAISKVQVFSDQTEQAKATGINDGKKEKTLNLELKEEFKKGGFGKVTASGGPATNADARGEIKGNYNKFDTKRQFSVIGLANNTNQTGLSFDDYQDFRGSNSFNWNDDADFGFSGGGRFIYFGGEDESLGIPIGGNRGQGFSRNAAAGVNYNYDTKKTKFSSNYYYNQSRQTLDIFRNRQNFVDGGSFINNENSNQFTFGGSHRATVRVEKTLDSLNTLVFLHNSRINNNDVGSRSLQELFRDTLVAGNRVTRTLADNSSLTDNFGMANTLIYRRKFKTKGRSFAASATNQINNASGTQDLDSETDFTTGQLPRVILQENNTTTRRNTYKLNLLYVEPITKKVFWESFYNFNLRNDVVDRNVFDRQADQNTLTRNDTLSRYYKNDYLFNRIGSGLRYSYKGINLSAGGALQRFQLNGRFASSPTAPDTSINLSYTLFVPNVSLNFDLKNNKYVSGGYNVDVQVPSSRQLQPVIDISNPLFITTGNPALLPELRHNLNANFYKFDPATFVNLSAYVYYTYNVNQIVNEQTVDLQTLVTRTSPINISGGQTIGTYLNAGFPIVKTKATINFSPSLNFSRNLTPINGDLNVTNGQSYNIRTRLDLTPTDWFTFYANADWGINNTRYSISTSQNQQILNYNYTGDMTIKLPKDLYVNSNLNYRIFRNERFNFDQRIPILNLTAYKILGKAKKAEIRLTAFDVLNRNVNVSQFASQTFVSQERITTLARYFMLGFTYNMRGVNTNIRKRRGY
ncbi:MAG: outer membrane beta-barrel protein [Bacteroidetes bacterium]|nr:outer membrane beta-barrel protein [Fibrella sp.]